MTSHLRNAAAGAAVAVAAAGACSRPAAPAAPAHQPGEEHLRSIRIEGNRQLQDRELLAGLALSRAEQRKRPLDPYLLQLDEERIRGAYLRRGFLGARVRARVLRDGDAATVVFTVEEGRRAVTRVEIAGIPGDPELPIAKLRAALPLADGAPFDYALYDEAKPRLLGMAQDAGYAHARLAATVEADPARGVARVRLGFELGPKCTFGPVEITGVTGELAGAVRARVAFEEGDRYSARALAKTQRRLYGMGRFSTVQVQPAETSAPVVGVKIAVAEAARREVRLGGGFGLEPTGYEARARVGYSIAGWPFPLDTAAIDLRPAYTYLRKGGGWEPRLRALARLERLDLLWTYARGEAEAGYRYLPIEAYTSYGPHARLGFLTPLGTERVQLGVGWMLERQDFRDVSPLIGPALAAELGIDRTQRIGAYTQLLTVDLRDDPVRTTRGAYGVLRSAIGTRYAGGAFEYVELAPELRGYLPLGRVILGARAGGGVIFGDVPATERFFSGGASRHRGFGERRLSPSVPGVVGGEARRVPYGGAAMVETSLEARLPIATWRGIDLGGAVFLDGGDVREARSEIDLGDLCWAAGVGLRFGTPVGPVRVDVGYRLNRIGGPDDPEPGSRLVFHVALGEAF